MKFSPSNWKHNRIKYQTFDPVSIKQKKIDTILKKKKDAIFYSPQVVSQKFNGRSLDLQLDGHMILGDVQNFLNLIFLNSSIATLDEMF